MSRKKIKQRKEKKKAEKAKNRVLKRREKIRKESREEKERQRISHMYRERKQPYVKKEHPMDSLVQSTKDNEEIVKKRLKKHQKELEVIENEFDEADECREELNKTLENQGIFDMKSKMEFLQDQAAKEAKRKQQKGKMKGSAGVSFEPNKKEE